MLGKVLTTLRNPNSLGQRAMTASLWQVGAMGVQYPLRLASNLILTRILAPEAFGMMAIITMVHVGLYLFTDVGIIQSVMRHKRGEEPLYLRVAWVVQVIRGIGIVTVLILIGLAALILGPRFAAPGTVYADPLLPGLIWFSGIGLMAKALESTNVLLAQRRMHQRLVVMTELICQVVGIVIMVSLAYVLENVWALAIGTVMVSILRCILSHTVFPGPCMRFAWDPEQAREMWAFGKWLIGASMGGFLLSYGDRLILSALIDKRVFGVYAISMVWIEMGMQLLQKTGAATLVPSFAEKINKDPVGLTRTLKKFIRIYDIVSFLVCILIFFVSELIFKYLYTEDYVDGAYYVKLLVFKIMFYRAAPIQHFLIASGNSRLFAVGNFLAAIFTSGLCYAGFLYAGLEGAVLGSVLGGLILPLVVCMDKDLQERIWVSFEILKTALIGLAAITIVSVLSGWV